MIIGGSREVDSDSELEARRRPTLPGKTDATAPLVCTSCLREALKPTCC